MRDDPGQYAVVKNLKNDANVKKDSELIFDIMIKGEQFLIFGNYVPLSFNCNDIDTKLVSSLFPYLSEIKKKNDQIVDNMI